MMEALYDFIQCLGVAAIVQAYYPCVPPDAVITHVRFIGNGCLNVGWSRP